MTVSTTTNASSEPRTAVRWGALIVIGVVLAFPGAAAPLHNVLLVIADDYGFDSQSLYNTNSAASLPPTPNINALAARGVRFLNAYGYPTCSPTRSAIITGRYGFRTGVTRVLGGPQEQGIYTNEYTLPEVLSSGGTYRCASIGKWHLGGDANSPNRVGGWSHFAGSLPGALGNSATNFYRWTKIVDGVVHANYLGYATTDNVDNALQWIASQGTNRWLLWLAFNAPHTPYHAPPSELRPHYPGLTGSATDIQRSPRQYYEAAVEALDLELGRLLSMVDTNDTTILFLGDNGTPPRVIQPPYDQGARAKDTLYEGGVRVPFIVAGPDIVAPGRTSDAVVHAVDLYATIVELAGMNVGERVPRSLPVDSRSLVPILRDEPFLPSEPAILIEDPDPLPVGTLTGRAARQDAYKLIRWDTGAEEFYELNSDPLELTNLITLGLTPGEESVLELLRAKLSAWSNAPVIYQQGLNDGVFSVELGWYAGAEFSLWRTLQLESEVWEQVSSATVQDQGANIRLSDPQPPAENAFYRVRQGQ